MNVQAHIVGVDSTDPGWGGDRYMGGHGWREVGIFAQTQALVLGEISSCEETWPECSGSQDNENGCVASCVKARGGERLWR